MNGSVRRAQRRCPVLTVHRGEQHVGSRDECVVPQRECRADGAVLIGPLDVGQHFQRQRLLVGDGPLGGLLQNDFECRGTDLALQLGCDARECRADIGQGEDERQRQESSIHGHSLRALDYCQLRSRQRQRYHSTTGIRGLRVASAGGLGPPARVFRPGCYHGSQLDTGGGAKCQGEYEFSA